MKTKGQANINSERLEDNINDRDYTVLRSSEKQNNGIKLVSERFEKSLGIDKKHFGIILNEIFTEMQIRESRFHFEMADDLPQVKLALKKMLEPQLTEKILELFPEQNNSDILTETIENLFQWYMNEYLLDN